MDDASREQGIGHETTEQVESVRLRQELEQKYNIDFSILHAWNVSNLFAQLSKMDSPDPENPRFSNEKEGGKHLLYELEIMDVIQRHWTTIASIFETSDSEPNLYIFSNAVLSQNAQTDNLRPEIKWTQDILRQQTLLMTLASDIGKLGSEQILGKDVGIIGRIYQQVHLHGAHSEYLRAMLLRPVPPYLRDVIESIRTNTAQFDAIFDQGKFLQMPLELGMYVAEQVRREELVTKGASEPEISALTEDLRLKTEDRVCLSSVGFSPESTQIGEFFTQAHLLCGKQYLEKTLGNVLPTQIAMSLSHHLTQQEAGNRLVSFDSKTLKTDAAARNALRLIAVMEILDKVDASMRRGRHDQSATKARIRNMLEENLDRNFSESPGIKAIYLDVFDRLEKGGVFKTPITTN